MHWLPSLLEYSTFQLDSKLSLIGRDIHRFGSVQRNFKSPFLNLHLDFVMGQFARSRSIMQSLSLESVFENLYYHLSDQKLRLTIHLMAETEDMLEVWEFLDNLQLNPNWKYLFLVSPEFYELLEQKFQGHLSFGVWLDVDQWQDKNDFLTNLPQTKHILLMTVKAGSSGQKLTEQTKTQSLEIVAGNPKLHFILDGGWQLSFYSDLENLSLVSYTSFWQKMGEWI